MVPGVAGSPLRALSKMEGFVVVVGVEETLLGDVRSNVTTRLFMIEELEKGRKFEVRENPNEPFEVNFKINNTSWM
jgi:hypothetical protein